MKPVDQTVLSKPDENVWGNCLEACVASLLEIPIEDVPNFGIDSGWFGRYLAFIREQGYEMPSHFHFPGGFPFGAGPDLGVGVDGCFIAAGPSPRQLHFGDGAPLYHAVIVDASGNVVHDPHPSRAGVLRVEEVDVIERRSRC